jgi:hypothetical protein
MFYCYDVLNIQLYSEDNTFWAIDSHEGGRGGVFRSQRVNIQKTEVVS